MVHSVFIAPKAVDTARAVALANHYQTGLELEVFIPPPALQNPGKTLASLQPQLSQLHGQLSLHGPVIDMNPVSMVKQIARVSDLHYKRSIEMALELKARYLVFHTQWTPIYTVADCYDRWADALATYFEGLVTTMGCANAGLTLVLENFMEPRPSLHLGVLERIDRPEVRACLDVGHTNLFSSLSPMAWFDALRPYLATLHLHNNSGLLDQHHGLAQGSVAMADFLAHVSQSQANVQLMLEVTGEQAVEESVAFISPYQQARQSEWLAKTFIL